LEKFHCLLKIVHDLRLRLIFGVTFGIQSANACPMLLPLMFPEDIVTTFVIFPILPHILKGVKSVTGLKDVGDVPIVSMLVTVSFVGAVAIIRPWLSFGQSLEKQGDGDWDCGKAHQRPCIVHESDGPVTG
jgi:hypothetical protein